MDNIKKLVENRQYELVIDLTKKPLTNDDIFYRITAFVGLGKGKEALDCIKTYQNQLEKDLPILMKTHIELLCVLNMFDEAYSEMEYYKSLPYFSQQAEELLKSLPTYIRHEEKASFSNKNVSDDELKRRLKSKDDQLVVYALDQLKDKDINLFMDEIKEILIYFPRQSIRSFALLELVNKKIDKEFDFLHVDKIIKVNPSKIEPPFVGTKYQFIINKIDNYINDVSLTQNAIQIFSSYVIYSYPDEIELTDELLEALFELSCKYMKIENKQDLKVRCEKKSLDYNKAHSLYIYLSLIMEDF